MIENDSPVILSAGRKGMFLRKLLATAAVASFTGSPLISETHRITPDRYYVTFSVGHPPIAHLRPGDTVVTKCLDSRGRDETGKLILDADNVLTGPFSIDGAMPGDTLVVRLDRVRLNRDWGWDGIRIATSGLAPETLERLFPADCCGGWLQPNRHNALRWTLDPRLGAIAPSRALGERVKLEFPAHRRWDVSAWLLRTDRQLTPGRWVHTAATWITTP
jgi:hypothetical protein